MNIKTVNSPNAPAAIGPYCHAKAVGGVLSTSGQLGLVPETGVLPQGVEAQTRQALENLSAVLDAAGYSMKDVVKTTIFLKNIGDFAQVNTVYARFFPENPPARSCVAVGALPKDGLVEIEAVAAR